MTSQLEIGSEGDNFYLIFDTRPIKTRVEIKKAEFASTVAGLDFTSWNPADRFTLNFEKVDVAFMPAFGSACFRFNEKSGNWIGSIHRSVFEILIAKSKHAIDSSFKLTFGGDCRGCEK